MSNSIRVVLDQQDFSALVNGEEVKKEANGSEVLIILSDIGWFGMAAALVLAQQGPDPAERRKALTKHLRD